MRELLNRSVVPGYVSGMMVSGASNIYEDSDKDYRNSEKTHVSALINQCPRAIALSRHFSVDISRQVYASERITQVIGRGIETYVRNTLINMLGGDSCYGDWVCDCGREVVRGYGGLNLANCRCSECGNDIHNYGELIMEDDEYGIVGRSDFIFRKINLLHVLEIKSIKCDSFDKLKYPYGDHIMQASIYRYLLAKKLGDDKVSPFVVILYVRKEQKRGSPFLDFVHDTRTNKGVVNKFLELAKQVNDPISFPDRLCESIHCSRAKQCPVINYCFPEGDKNESE